MTHITITPEEFLEKASADQINFIHIVGGELLRIGILYADAEAKYYTAKAKADKNTDEFEELTADHQSLTVEYDTVKHLLSALQSTLRAEWQLSQTNFG